VLLKETAVLRLAALRIPMILYLGPRVLELDEEGCAVEIPLSFRSRNHLIGGMYFGALCAGADLAAGLNAAKLMLTSHRGLNLVFGSLQAEFLKRADGDVVFRSRQGRQVREAVERAHATGERAGLPIDVVATVPRRHGDEPVARFTLALSLKRKE
jgi:acyl-coenzyme A thioesterase PaaI-like protein